MIFNGGRNLRLLRSNQNEATTSTSPTRSGLTGNGERYLQFMSDSQRRMLKSAQSSGQIFLNHSGCGKNNNSSRAERLEKRNLKRSKSENVPIAIVPDYVDFEESDQKMPPLEPMDSVGVQEDMKEELKSASHSTSSSPVPLACDSPMPHSDSSIASLNDSKASGDDSDALPRCHRQGFSRKVKIRGPGDRFRKPLSHLG